MDLISTPLTRFCTGLALALLLVGCDVSAKAPAATTAARRAEPGPELSVFMGELQRHSAKLGYAIAERNQALADFYFEEVEETLARVEQIEVHDGQPIGKTAKTIMGPLLFDLEELLEGSDWNKNRLAYEALIDGCNRCHFATQHEFIAILPAQGEPPYNQRFSATK